MQPLLPDAATHAAFGAWSLQHHSVVTSTNLVAARLPPWTAVRAEIQTAGRGRFERSWVSDQGGLWLSAVLPVAPQSPSNRLLPLAVGLAVFEALATLGLNGLRLRWPNDLLVGQQKLAGLLLDRFDPDRVVAGIGINVVNHPDYSDPSLAGQAARLADLVSPAPGLDDLAARVLASLREVWGELERSGPQPLLARINTLWQGPRRVELELDSGAARGEFIGVDGQGRLELRSPGEASVFFEPQDVKRLREIELSKP